MCAHSVDYGPSLSSECKTVDISDCKVSVYHLCCDRRASSHGPQMAV